MPQVFISYVRENSAEVQRLANELISHGIKVWLDKYQIKPGYRWKDAIREGISNGEFFIACFSNEYNSRSKTYMNEELVLAIDELRQRSADRAWFIPVLLSETQVPNRDIGAGETLRSIQWVELYKNWDDGIRSILSVIQPDAMETPEIDLPILQESDWEILLQRINDGKCTPFIGPAFDDGVIPYDTALAQEWALKYDYPLDNSIEIAKVAQFLTRTTDKSFPKKLIQERIKNISPPDFSETNEPHAILADLPVLIYITTNYDDFMEQALRAQNKKPSSEFVRWNEYLSEIPSIFDDIMFEPAVETPVVFHIYGHAQVPESIVVTEEDHFDFSTKFASENCLPQRIKVALTLTLPLLLGFSLSENKFRNLFHLLIPYFNLNINHFRMNTYRPAKRGNRDAEEYLQKYLSDLKEDYYWGSFKDWMTELRSRWEIFGSGDDA